MDNIEEIWNKGNKQISKDKSFRKEFIIKSISESSISIGSKLVKVLRFGMVLNVLAALGFVYNLIFYINNTAILSAILILILLSVFIFRFLYIQAGVIKNPETGNLDLRSLLVSKIKFFTSNFQIALHLISFSVILVTFTLNLTIENADGIFELRKLFILLIFYTGAYFLSLFLLKISHSVYLKQLKNALYNLEENTLVSLDKELKKHKRLRTIILVISLILIISGIFFLFLKGIS